MATSNANRSTKISLSVPVRIDAPKIEIFDLGKTIDRVALQRGSHRLIIGRLQGDCCSKLLRARIKGGQVIGLEIERCKKSTRNEQPTRRLLRQAARKLVNRKRRAFKPIPIAQFLKPDAMSRMATNLVIENCERICVPTLGPFGWGLRCYLCCTDTWYLVPFPRLPQPKGTSHWCLPW